jgi:hypothetical protein
MRMTEQPSDVWAERRSDIAALVEQLSPSEALEVLSRVVKDAADSTMLAVVLIGTIRGIVERRTEGEHSASQEAYEAMKEHAPDISDKVD